MRVIVCLALLLIANIVKGQNVCYVSLWGTDNSTCGNATTTSCATITQCLKNNPYANHTGSSVQIQMSPGVYSGSGFCNITVQGLVR